MREDDGRCIGVADRQWKDKSEEALPAGGVFLVIVAQNGADDRPDPSTLQAFTMEGSTGLSYAPGVWRMSTSPPLQGMR